MITPDEIAFIGFSCLCLMELRDLTRCDATLRSKTRATTARRWAAAVPAGFV
jgi:hypothetical protein